MAMNELCVWKCKMFTVFSELKLQWRVLIYTVGRWWAARTCNREALVGVKRTMFVCNLLREIETKIKFSRNYFFNLKLLKTFILSLFLGIAYRLCSPFLVKHQHHSTHSAIRQFSFVEFSEELQIEKRKRNCCRPACCGNENKNESHSHLAIFGAISSINCK